MLLRMTELIWRSCWQSEFLLVLLQFMPSMGSSSYLWDLCIWPPGTHGMASQSSFHTILPKMTATRWMGLSMPDLRPTEEDCGKHFKKAKNTKDYWLIALLQIVPIHSDLSRYVLICHSGQREDTREGLKRTEKTLWSSFVKHQFTTTISRDIKRHQLHELQRDFGYWIIHNILQSDCILSIFLCFITVYPV